MWPMSGEETWKSVQRRRIQQNDGIGASTRMCVRSHPKNVSNERSPSTAKRNCSAANMLESLIPKGQSSRSSRSRRGPPASRRPLRATTDAHTVSCPISSRAGRKHAPVFRSSSRCRHSIDADHDVSGLVLLMPSSLLQTSLVCAMSHIRRVRQGEGVTKRKHAPSCARSRSVSIHQQRSRARRGAGAGRAERRRLSPKSA